MDVSEAVAPQQQRRRRPAARVLGTRVHGARARLRQVDRDDIEKVVLKTRRPRHAGAACATSARSPSGRRSAAASPTSNGEGDAVGGIVVMRHGENALDVIDRVKASDSRSCEPSLPEGVQVVTTYDRSELIDASIDNLKHELLIEIVIVSLVILVFLWHIPSAIVPIITIPVSVLLAFIPMRLMGISSNIMSLAGIAISIGVLVDGAIVEVENAYKKLEQLAARTGGRVTSTPCGSRRSSKSDRPSSSRCSSSRWRSCRSSPSWIRRAASSRRSPGRRTSPCSSPRCWPSRSIRRCACSSPAWNSDSCRPRAVSLAGQPGHGRPVLPGGEASDQPHPLRRLRACMPARAAAPKTTICARRAHRRVDDSGLPAASATSSCRRSTKARSSTCRPRCRASRSPRPDALLQTQDRILKSFPEVVAVFGKAGRAEYVDRSRRPFSMMETTVMLKPPSEWRAQDRVVFQLGAGVAAGARAATRLARPALLGGTHRRDGRGAADSPASTNAWTMPIKARIDMLTTGVRTPVGIKIFGGRPQRDRGDRRPSSRRFCATCRAPAACSRSGRPVDTSSTSTSNREALARLRADGRRRAGRHHVRRSAGENVTTTIEGRARYPVNVRYPRDLRDDLRRLGQVLVIDALRRAGAARADRRHPHGRPGRR